MSKKGKFTLEPEDAFVMQDYQLAINHLTEAQGRFLGHIGVKKYGLKEGKAYKFEPNWIDGTISYEESKPTQKLAK